MSTYTKHTWGWEIVRVLRDAQRAGNRAGMTEADILLVMANTITSRGIITGDKKKVPGYLNVLRSQLDLNKCGMFEKAGCLSPDCKPKQQLWKLVRNAQTENIPDVEKSTYVSYDDIDLERYQISEASAKYISLSEDDPVAKTRGEKARAAATTTPETREGPGARASRLRRVARGMTRRRRLRRRRRRGRRRGGCEGGGGCEGEGGGGAGGGGAGGGGGGGAKAKKAAAKEAAAKEAAAKERRRAAA